jgi:hypothetical protein
MVILKPLELHIVIVKEIMLVILFFITQVICGVMQKIMRDCLKVNMEKKEKIKENS